MGAVRQRISRRVPYAKLRERLCESGLPWDDRAERQAIGAVLLAPREHQRRLVRKLYHGHFYDRGHGWLWDELGTWLNKCKLALDTAEQLKAWLEKAEATERFKERFWGSAAGELRACIDIAFWWHGDWYVGRVLEVAKVRARITGAAEQLNRAMNHQWRQV